MSLQDHGVSLICGTSDFVMKLNRGLLPAHCERQLRIYGNVPSLMDLGPAHRVVSVRDGHVVSLPDVDPTHGVISVQDNPEWRRTKGTST